MESNDIKKRLLNNINIPLVDLFYFLEIFKIEISKKVDSAAISLEERPTLFINEDFVNKYCKTDEHLLMLVMHELYHFILGHTSLVERSSTIDNIVFDAIINSTLVKLFNEDEYTSFFSNVNPSNEFPACLLHAPNENTLPEYKTILYMLYHTNMATYDELYSLFNGKFKENYILLGNHKNPNPLSPFSKSIAEGLNGNELLNKVPGMDEIDGILSDVFVKYKPFDKEKYAKISSFINKITKDASESTSIGRVKREVNVSRKTFMPNLMDRYKPVKDMFFKDNLLYKNQYKISMYTQDTLKKVLVYLDVSGSMAKELKYILPIISKLRACDKIEVYQFSTKVCPLPLNEIKLGKLNTTGGTDLNSVLKHYFETKKRMKNILIITDGCIPNIKPKYKKLLEKNKVNIYTIVTDYNTQELDSITTTKLRINGVN